MNHNVIAGWVLVSMVGCASPSPPVATATLGLNRVSAPLGAPIELNVRFDVAPDLDRLAEDYRVLVHILDADEELLWTEDHDPPVPTSQWQPGQRVAYTHRVRIPMYPYIGDALIAIGLYSPTSGIRIPLAGDDLGQQTYRVATLRLDPQPESSFLVYDEGWHQAEFDGDGRHDWRWTTGLAVLSFRNPLSDASLALEIEGQPDMFETPQQLSIVVGERTLHKQVVLGGAQYLEVDIAAADLGTDDVVRLEIHVDKTFSPASRGGASGDTRELGLRVFHAYFEPR